MKKIFTFFCFLFLISNAGYYEILEYPASVPRMRKRLRSYNKEIKIIPIIDLDIPDELLYEKKSPIVVDTTDALDDKALAESQEEPLQKEKESKPIKETLEKQATIKKSKTSPLVAEKQKSYLQKEVDISTMGPCITKKAADTSSDSAAESTSTIMIQNNITREMISYHHWTGSYTPEFSIIINEIIIPSDEIVSIPMKKPLKIEYKAIFPYGYSSADFIEYQPQESVAKIILEFDWHQTPRVIITEIAH